MTEDRFDLPHMEEVFDALRRGRHITLRDGELFQALQNHHEEYTELFGNLGFDLVHHSRDFYYFRDRNNFTDRASRIAVFMFILVEWLADQGEPVEETIMTRRFDVDDLPHLESERYVDYMREAGVRDRDDLVRVIQSMARFGFARRTGGGTLEFAPPIYRFLEMCMDMIDDGEEKGGEK